VLASPAAVSLTAKVPTPPWRRTELPGADVIYVDKQLQNLAERTSIAVKYIADNFPHAQRTQVYTDRSARKATENGARSSSTQTTSPHHRKIPTFTKLKQSSPRCNCPQETDSRREGQTGDLHRLW
jgi:hypothetical protein